MWCYVTDRSTLLDGDWLEDSTREPPTNPPLWAVGDVVGSHEALRIILTGGRVEQDLHTHVVEWRLVDGNVSPGGIFAFSPEFWMRASRGAEFKVTKLPKD